MSLQLEFRYLKAMVLLHLIERQYLISDSDDLDLAVWTEGSLLSKSLTTSCSPPNHSSHLLSVASMLKNCLSELRSVESLLLRLLHRIQSHEENLHVENYNIISESPYDLVFTCLDQISVSIRLVTFPPASEGLSGAYQQRLRLFLFSFIFIQHYSHGCLL